MTHDILSINFATATVETLARDFHRSEAWAAGLLDAVTGDQDWSLMYDTAEVEPTRAEIEDYQDGYRTGQDLLDRAELVAAGEPQHAA